MNQKHCYLFALEVANMQVGDVYEELPLHCTLMHRFWSELSPEELANRIRPFFDRIQPGNAHLRKAAIAWTETCAGE